jgi:hypothetical protein
MHMHMQTRLMQITDEQVVRRKTTLPPTRDEPIQFVKSRKQCRLFRHEFLNKYIKVIERGNWFQHSSYNESANSSWWNPTYQQTDEIANIPTCLDHLIPMLSTHTNIANYEDSDIEMEHRRIIRNAFAHRRYNVIVCRAYGEGQEMYPGVQFLELS